MNRIVARLVNAWRALRGLPPSTIWRYGDTPIGWFSDATFEDGAVVRGILRGPRQ